MSLVSEWTETARSVLTSPAEFFRTEMRRDGFGYPLRFAALSLVLSAIIGSIGTLGFGLIGPESIEAVIVAAVSTLVVGPIAGIIGLFIGAAIIHIFVAILGGDYGYSQTFAVLAYATALSPIAALLGIVPVIGGILGLIVALYGLYIQIKGIELFQQMSTGRAAAAVLIPGIIIFVIVIVLLAVIASFLAIGNLATAPA